MLERIPHKQVRQRRSVALIIVGLVLVWMLSAVILWGFYRTSVDNFRAEANNQVLLSTQYFALNQSLLTNAKLNELERTLRAIAQVAAVPDVPDHDLLGIMYLRRQVSPEIADFLLLDPDGQIRLWTRDDAEQKPLVSDRDYFRVHVDTPSAQTYLSSPGLSRIVESRPFMAMSRGLYNANGEFVGVLAMALDIERFASALGGITELQGVTTVLADHHGHLLFRRPFIAYETGQVLDSIAGYRGDPPFRASKVLVSPFDGATRQVSFRRLDDWPWVAFVGAELAPTLAAIETYRAQEALRFWVLQSVITLMLVLIGWLTWQRMRSERALMEDIVQRQAVEKRLAWQANHDALTGLPNRMLFYDRLKQTLQRGARYERTFGLIYIDLDGFKEVNDQYGHAAGDELLQVVAERLQAAVRASDTVARLAGDEFIVLADQCTLPAASALADKILVSLSEPIELTEHAVRITASIGVAVAPDDGEDVDVLIKAADTAMYDAKNTGKGRVAVAGRTRA